MMRTLALFAVCIVFVFNAMAFAGPPFRTDDPIPVPFMHGEVYLFSTGVFDESGAAGIGPAVEFNYGILPNTQFHAVLPLAFNSPKDNPSQMGYGDTEVGVKYRFIEQTDYLPDIGTFPIAELPTGNASRGLGNGKAQIYLPLWLQKDIGHWTIYGGGGYWINPGPENKNWTFSGILIQYNFSENFYLGTELFHQSPSLVNAGNNTGIHIGGGVTVIKNYQVLFSSELGNGITSYKHYAYYLGLYHNF
ncbi:MAG: hypothetical protein ACM3UR_12740 [Bacteroidota bacterium]